MRGLSFGLSLGVSVVCGVVGCSTGKGTGTAPTPREIAGGSSVAMGQGGTPTQIISGGGAPNLMVGTTPIMDAGVPDANIDAGECATLSVETHELVATVDLLVDTSGSMFQQPTPFWTPLHTALMDAAGVVKQLQASTRFGFTSYTGTGTGAMCPILKKVPYALNNYDAIETVYGGIKYNNETWETPTHAAVDAATADLVAFKPMPDGPKYILLVTDGSPDTCWTVNPQCGQDASIKAIQAAFAQGITTYVLGIGDVLGAETGCQTGRCGRDYLQDAANAGTGQPVEPVPATDTQYAYSGCVANSPTKGLTATYAAEGGGGKAPYYTVKTNGTTSDVTPLVTEIKKALVQTRSCSFAMTAKLPGGMTTGVKITTNAAKGKFNYNDKPLIYSDPNGWILNADQTGITLSGTACESWKTTGGTVTGSFPCEVTFDPVPPPEQPT